MDKQTLKNMPLTAFNEEGWLKPPLLIFLNLIFMAKGALIFIGSLASRSAGDQILALLYPDKTALYISLALSVIPLATIVFLSLGEIHEKLQIKKILFILCVAELAGEFSFAIKVLVTSLDPLSSTTLKLLVVQLILVIFALKSQKVMAFFKQISDEKPILKSE